MRRLREFLPVWAVASILICMPIAAHPQAAPEPRPAITVSGTVSDRDGKPVAGATVVFSERGTSASVEAKTPADGAFSFLAVRAGTYIVRARKEGMREAASEPLELSLGQRKRIDLVLAPDAGKDAVESPKQNSPKSQSGAMQFDDKPSFTVAGVTDWTNVGGHGSDTKLRTSESLARETATLKPSESASTSAATLEAARAADSHRGLGDRAERAGDPLVAVREYEQAVRLDPSEQNYFAWGTELLVHRAIKPAAEVFEKGSSAHRQSARMLAGLGAALYAGGDYANAARRVCEASDLQPADPAPYLFLGKMEKTAPDTLPCAAEKLARFAHDQPANALANYYFAMSLWKRAQRSGQPANSAQAEALLKKAVAADPQLDEAFVQLGVVYVAEGNSQEAIAAYKKAIEINPQSAEGHYRLALAYKRAGDHEKSEREMQLFKEADKNETAAIEQQRREIRQFMIILKDQPQASAPHAEKEKPN
jgi:tetratricopeptide (TPR) repeat protein